MGLKNMYPQEQYAHHGSWKRITNLMRKISNLPWKSLVSGGFPALAWEILFI